MNGVAGWKTITEHFDVPKPALDKMLGLEKPDVIEVAKMVSPDLVSALKAIEQGGGGWSLCGSAYGKTSKVTGDITYELRCRSYNSYCCPAKSKLIFRKATNTMHLTHAQEWKHTHSGVLSTSQGLPPAIKMIVDQIIDNTPGIKLKALKNQLWEVHKVSKDEFESKVHNYFYQGCKDRRKSLDTTTGISSFGTAKTFAESHMLLDDLLPEHVVSTNAGYLDAPGVVGYYTEPDESRCYVLFSSAKLLLDMYLQSIFGYSMGQLHVDFTFKLLQEQIPFFVSSVTDIQQHVHPAVLGPCTHQDMPQVAMMMLDMKNAAETLVKKIAYNDEEHWDNWPDPLRKVLVDTYRQLIIDGARSRTGLAWDDIDIEKDLAYDPSRVMADAADALANAAKKIFGNGIGIGMCWPHVWRAIKAKHHLLRTNSEERQKELFTDLNFIHETTVVEIIPKLLDNFYEKWTTKGEVPFVDYIRDEWGGKKWMRAYCEPGEPSDNNTLESLNRTLKTDSAFGKTTSLGLCLDQCLITVHRLSRDVKLFLEVDAPVVKKTVWVDAQKLVSSSYFKLGYKMSDKVVIPSSKLLDQCPGTTVVERRQNMSTWVKEYVSMMKNPDGYYKVHGPNGWDFDTLVDYLFSFWVMEMKRSIQRSTVSTRFLPGRASCTSAIARSSCTTTSASTSLDTPSPSRMCGCPPRTLH